MIIETQYDVSDTVFALINNKVVELIVDAVGVSEFPNNINYPLSGYIYYNVRNNLKEVVKIYQNQLFPSKEALLQSL